MNPPVHDCDRLGASSSDDRAVALPVSDKEIDPERAILACKAALNEFPDTPRFQAQLGRALYKADRDEEAVEWVLKAAEGRYGYGMYVLGVIYAEGRRVPKDDAQALAWFRKAVEQGIIAAQVWLGVLYLEGRGAPQDDAKALAWFRKAAELGSSSGQARLGWMYREGRGVRQDDAQAVAWFRRAAERGNASAQGWLGWMYVAGRGLPQDDAQAVSWFRKAAEQGDIWAQNTLGGMYSEGRGVPQDRAEAQKWYEAATRSVAEAKVAPARLDPGARGPASAAAVEPVGQALSAQGNELEAQEALNIIADFADRICTKVPVEGSGVEIRLSGEAKAELSNLLQHFADLGIEGSGKYKSGNYQGVLREELANAIRSSDDCRRSVFEKLNDKLFLSRTLQQQSCRTSQFFEVCLIDSSRKGNVVSIALSIKNQTNRNINASMFREYAVLVASTGERLSRSSNRFSIQLIANGIEYLSYDFAFKRPIVGESFDFTLELEEPRSQFGFFNVAAR